MKKSLLATVAAAALFAGSGLAVAQGAKEQPAAKGGAEMQRGAEPKGAEPKAGGEMKGGADVKRSQTTGQGAAEGKADHKAGGNAQMKSDSKSTTGQAAPEQKVQGKDAPASKAQAQDNKAQQPSRNQAQDNKSQQPAAKSAQDNKASGNTTGQAAAGSTQAGGAVSLTTEQKTKIRTTVIQSSSAPKVSRSSINFNISVGTVVPRTVKIVSVPATLVEIHPAWRGYSYFIVDDEIIIVEPGTFKIIAVVNV